MATEFGGQGERRETSAGNKRDLPSSQQEQADLEIARTILQTIVNTHEKTINETTPLDRIAEYSTEQERQAERVVAQSLMDTHGVVKSSAFERTLRKNTPQGRLTLSLSDDNVHMYLWNEQSHEVELANTYALQQPKSGTEWYYGFDDHRHHDPWTWEKFSETAYRLKRKQSLLSIRYDRRGLRWMNANMLGWNNPDTIMPEQLDSLPLPPRQGENKTT